MQEHTGNGTPTPADQLSALASGPAFTPRVVYSDMDRSMLRKIPMPPTGHQWSAALGGLVLPIDPSDPERVNLLDPLAVYGVCDAGPTFSSSAAAPQQTTPREQVR